jgi:hypothetical protein
MANEKKIKKNPNLTIDDNYNDEIDLFELLQKIWKWKWLIIAIIIFTILMTYLYNIYNIKSNIKAKLINPTHTAQTLMKIGSIAGQGIDSFTYNSPTITNISKNIEKKYSKRINIPATANNKIEINFKSNNNKTNFNKIDFSLKIEPLYSLYSISITSSKAEFSLEVINYIVKIILQEHKKLYIDGLNKLNKNIDYFKRKETIESNVYFSIPYLLDSYNYQSEIITDPILLIPEPATDGKLAPKLAVAFIASLFIGIFISLFIEFINTHMRKTD